MTKYVIHGGRPLFGEIDISGAKNAAVAIIPAALLVDGVCRIENIPQISDVTLILNILQDLGADVRTVNRTTVDIDCSHIRNARVPEELARKIRASYYLIGALLGRFVCGWLCPFGLVQDLLHKIPFPKKLKRLPGDRVLKYLRYVVLVGFVIILPLTVLDVVGQGSPWYCKYICPSGTLFAGIPLVASNPGLQAALGWLFSWKAAILIVLLLLSVVVYRPFCRYLCPLGAVYGLFNPIAFYRYEVDADKCVSCGACSRACGFGLEPDKHPNSPECIRCGECIKACPHGAICSTLKRKKEKTARG